MSEEIIYYQIPRLSRKYAKMKECAVCGKSLSCKFFKIYLYDTFNNDKVATRIHLCYCNECNIPYCTTEDEKSVKRKFPDLHIQSIFLDRNSHISVETQIKENIFTLPQNFIDTPLLPVGSVIYIKNGKSCTYDKKKIKKTPFKMINQNEKIERRYLYKCEKCGKIFIKGDVYERNKENYSKYKFIKQKDKPTVKTDPSKCLRKGTTIYVGIPADYRCP